jgi:hypothetical protein
MMGTELDNFRRMLTNAGIVFKETVPPERSVTQKKGKPYDLMIETDDTPEGYMGFCACFYFWHGALISMGCWE